MRTALAAALLIATTAAGDAVCPSNPTTAIHGCPVNPIVTTLQASGGTQSDAVIANYTAITGIAFTPLANTNYLIDCVIVATTTAATTGMSLAFDVPAAASINARWSTSSTAAGGTEGVNQNSDATATTTANGIVTVENTWVGTAVLRNGANSTSTTLGFTPETANSVSVIGAKSMCRFRTF